MRACMHALGAHVPWRACTVRCQLFVRLTGTALAGQGPGRLPHDPIEGPEELLVSSPRRITACLGSIPFLQLICGQHALWPGTCKPSHALGPAEAIAATVQVDSLGCPGGFPGTLLEATAATKYALAVQEDMERLDIHRVRAQGQGAR
eukprot:1145112-Pelagomonas_calceolata.AAC.2